ncbi:hypothetical protein CesoFtcFv8_000202 [Champsocephalus esox]|uniref:Uncharacterized protein n=1 Tax=Champsocephalus esox TaxID=159716 RepID=A0AAN8E4L0_9TELE|nr:hypothetical protein CesoFtcFv8_000202 [Champsocephalus esox]
MKGDASKETKDIFKTPTAALTAYPTACHTPGYWAGTRALPTPPGTASRAPHNAYTYSVPHLPAPPLHPPPYDRKTTTPASTGGPPPRPHAGVGWTDASHMAAPYLPPNPPRVYPRLPYSHHRGSLPAHGVFRYGPTRRPLQTTPLGRRYATRPPQCEGTPWTPPAKTSHHTPNPTRLAPATGPPPPARHTPRTTLTMPADVPLRQPTKKKPPPHPRTPPARRT